jgi:hypothetical protein
LLNFAGVLLDISGGTTMQNDVRKIAYSVDDIVKLVGIGRSLLFEELAAGRILAKKIGRRTVILETDLSAWLKSLPEKGPCESKQTKLKPSK